MFPEPRIKRLFTTLWNTRYTGDFAKARLLAKQAIRLPGFDYDARKATVTSAVLKTNFDVEKHFAFLPELHNLEELVGLAGAKLEARDDGSLDVEVRGVCVKAFGPEQVAILRELFVNGIYNFHAPGKTVVLDIGMNMGIASLFFALKPNVERIVAYEPFDETHGFAVKNLEANPELAKKIDANRAAVSDRDGEIEVDYSSTQRNCNGILQDRAEKLENTQKKKVKLVDAASVVRRLTEEYPDCSIVAKVDCEGSEYAIFERLRSAGLLSNISVFMVEWHERGPGDLEKALTEAGFFVMSFHSVHQKVGMLYAVRNRGE